MKNKKLYNYIFHYNPYKEEWAVIERGDGNWEKYINGEEYVGYRAKNINTLLSYITQSKNNE